MLEFPPFDLNGDGVVSPRERLIHANAQALPDNLDIDLDQIKGVLSKVAKMLDDRNVTASASSVEKMRVLMDSLGLGQVNAEQLIHGLASDVDMRA